jgi:DNA polymerase-3 subunit delta'
MLRPYSAPVQAAVLDGADRMTEEAANALLKVLEEPPTHTRFLLTTSRLSHCLPTIVSRCQVARCGRLPHAVVKRILMEAQGCEAAIAEVIAHRSGGSASCAIGLARRWAEDQQIVARLASDSPSSWVEQPLPETREEVAALIDAMMAWLRDVAVVASGAAGHVQHEERAGDLNRQARAVEAGRCVEAALGLVALRESLDQFVSPRLVAALAREKWLSLTAGTKHV